MEYKELVEKFLTTQTEIITKLTIIETKIDDYKEVKGRVDTALNKSTQNEKDINEINDKLKWISRAIIGAIISCLVALLFAFIKV